MCWSPCFTHWCYVHLSDNHPPHTVDPVTYHMRLNVRGDYVVPIHLPVVQRWGDLSDGGSSNRLGIRLVGSRSPDVIATFILGFTADAPHAVVSCGLHEADEVVQVRFPTCTSWVAVVVDALLCDSRKPRLA